MAPGSLRGLQLCVADVAAAYAELADRGVEVSDITSLSPEDRGTFFRIADADGTLERSRSSGSAATSR